MAKNSKLQRKNQSKGKRLNPFEWARHRPDTCIGSVKTTIEKKWIYDDDEKKAILREISFNPGLFNIVREIVSNVIDNVWRSAQYGKPMKKVEITVDEETGEISVWNDGYCIPVRKETYEYTDHRTGKTISEQLYPAETFFGDMFASTNYDDTSERKTSGRNGMGAKATNVFSTSFRVECTSPEDKKKFVQVFTNCGLTRTDPEITTFRNKIGYTKITFTPDYEYFCYPEEDNCGIDEDFVSLLKLYAYEAAMITGVLVKFNGQSIKMESMGKYVRLFFKGQKMVSFKSSFGDECVIIQNTDTEMEEQRDINHVSFVNGIRTQDGGIHVNKWKDTIIPAFVRMFNEKEKKSKGPEIKISGHKVLPHLLFFIRVEVDRPRFKSQTKDYLAEIMGKDKNGVDKSIPYSIYNPRSKKEKEEWQLQITNNFTKMMKWEFVSYLRERALFEAEKGKPSKKAKRGERVLLGSKADDANKAKDIGGESINCTLYVAEGDSARAFIDRGISHLDGGRDYNGSLAIQGKIINVVKQRAERIENNKEIKLLIHMLGVKKFTDYTEDENFRTLRYGKLCFVTDNDVDGFHIRGLLLNLFFKYYPSLISRGYVFSLSTPVVDICQGKKKRLFFYTELEFESFRQSTKLTQKILINYRKGLGSLDRRDAPLFFAKDPKYIEYCFDGKEKEMIQLGFGDGKINADARKEWLKEDLVDAFEGKTSTQSVHSSVSEGQLSITDFINSDLKMFSLTALRRAIPSIWDGLKVSQRKIIYGMFYRLKEKPTVYNKPVGVGIVAGAIKEITGYHHGEKSLEDAIVCLGQDFVGSNNVPLIENSGTEYGTRKSLGKDRSEARYLTAQLSRMAQILFNSLDEPLLERLYSDGIQVEYKHYMPILPVVLMNGVIGIATGFSSTVPSFNPLEITNWIKCWLCDGDTDELDELKPWYWGYQGDIDLIHNNTGIPSGWASKGKLFECPGKGCKVTTVKNKKCEGKKGWWHITELGVGVSTEACKIWLEYLCTGTTPEGKRNAGKWKNTKNSYIHDFNEYHTANTVHFMIKPKSDFIPDMDVVNNMKTLLTSKGSFNNMWLLDENNYPHKFETAEDILETFCPKRLEYYSLRKDYLLKDLKREYSKASNRYRFVKAVRDKKINLGNIDEGKELCAILENDPWNFEKIFNKKSKKDDFEYLLSMHLRSMTPKKLAELKKEKEKYWEKLNDLKETSPRQLWLAEIEEFEIEYNKFIKTHAR